MAFDIFLLTLFLSYSGTALLLLLGTSKTAPCANLDLHPSRTLPRISVVLAARNEEDRLPSCLAALLRLDYPHEKIEIIVIDDRSTDCTGQIAEKFARGDGRIHVLTVTQRLPGMSGKASALCQGMQHAHGELILLTDVDCIVPPHWARAMVAHFSPEVGLVGGFTLLSPSPALRALVPAALQDQFFAKVQTLDWMYLLTAGAGAAGWGKPISILGNNFGFRRAAYEQVGGYEKLSFSIIEDFALMKKIARTTKWRVCFSLSSDTAIFSFPPQSWREYVEQRKRWAAGGKEVGIFATALMLLAFLAHIAILPALFLNWKLALFGLVTLSLADVLLLYRSASALQFTSLLKYFPLFEIYFLIYSLSLACTVIFPTTIRWKGLRYHWNIWGKVKSIDE